MRSASEKTIPLSLDRRQDGRRELRMDRWNGLTSEDGLTWRKWREAPITDNTEL